MNKWIAGAALVCAGAALIVAQPQSKDVPRSAAATDSKTARAFVNQYCVNCHNTRAPQPVSHPVDLEKANLDNLLANAETWERVLHKLSVRAMPPQNMARPQEAEYVAFT